MSEAGQEEVIRLPIIKLWDCVLVTLQGEITDRIANTLSRQVLSVIHESGAEGLVLDVTGVWMMDSYLCSVLTRLAAAAKLIGTRTVISGMSPEIAQTLQTMGVEFEETETTLTVEQALKLLGLEVTVNWKQRRAARRQKLDGWDGEDDGID